MPSESESPLAIYLREVGRYPLLTTREEIELAARIKKGDEAALHHMINCNLRLVVKIANDYTNCGLSLLDLLSEGDIGLMKGVERFDPEKAGGGKLSKMIRLPVHVVDKLAAVRKVSNRVKFQQRYEKRHRNCAAEALEPVVADRLRPCGSHGL